MRIMLVEGGSGPMVYCKEYGAIAGVSTKCACWEDYHSFISVPEPNQGRDEYRTSRSTECRTGSRDGGSENGDR